MRRGDKVERPTKKAEFTIRYASSQAKKGWQDLLATLPNPMVDAWDFLTRTPTEKTPTNSPMRGELQVIERGGVRHERWQYKPTAKGDARIWFFVVGSDIFLEQVHTRHPDQTK